MLHRALFALVVVSFTGCTAPAETPFDSTDSTDSLAGEDAVAWEAGKELLGVSPDYRSVGYELRGPRVSGISTTSEVWPVSRRWYEVSDEAGIAWSADSGLTWDEKYAAWLDAMGATASDDGHITVEILTPWGKKLPSPRLECAELAMFLRVTFASWYELPFFMSAWSSTYGNMYSGHFGIVDPNGARISGTPNYRTSYEDYTDDVSGWTNQAIVSAWPDDAALEAKYLTSAKDDFNEFLGDEQYAGAYFDEIFLNKRVGHFLLRLLTWHGSMHLASANNMWNLEPEEIREGDVLLHRWQSQGIGHTMVIKEVDELAGGNLDVEFVFGSMPRIQPKWYEASIAKSYFTSRYAGSGDTDGDGTPYSHLGGGLKRWRTPVVLNGYWTNIVPTTDRDAWIGSTDYEAIEGRIATFQSILGNLTPTEERAAILARIEMARTNLSHHPSSCTNRQRREEAFDELYALMASEWGWTKEQVDQQYRELSDYTFAELDYTRAKTCCWNSTTEAMHDLILEYNTERIEDADANDECVEPVVFKARNGGYDPFRQYAWDTGRGAQWVEWSADESCPQASVQTDAEVNAPWTDFCDIVDSVMGWNQCSNGSDPTLWYLDDDGDGYGIGGLTEEACSQPSGYASTSGDCDDGDAYAHPGATEYCDGEDNDCDGTVDEGCDSGGNPGGNTGGSSGGVDCGSGCDARRLSGPGVSLWMFFGTFGLFLRRRRW